MYADLHCDSLTASLPCGGMGNFFGHINFNNLKTSCCIAQCFAIFTNGQNALNTFEGAIKNYNFCLSARPDLFVKGVDLNSLNIAVSQSKCAAFLTIENLGFIGDDLNKIAMLKDCGVIIASLVWNDENQFAYPNVKEGNPTFREVRGLKELGKQAILNLQKNNILIDVSHLSDGGFDDVVTLSKLPIVATHSNCAKICNVSRNLTDCQIKKIADSGGVMGINFCKKFLGGDDFSAVLAHLKHAINVGGEDVVAIGSDFDGAVVPSCLNGCNKVESLLCYLLEHGINSRICEKFAYKNFERIINNVIGFKN
jgi:membrane dipeptidase